MKKITEKRKLKSLLTKRQQQLDFLQEVLNMESLTLNELLLLLSDDEKLIIVLGDSFSGGIDILNLKTMEVDEWTW